MRGAIQRDAGRPVQRGVNISPPRGQLLFRTAFECPRHRGEK